MILSINNSTLLVDKMAVATNEGLEFSAEIQSLNTDYLSTLAKLPDNYTEEDKFTLINLVEKFKVASNYLRVNDHTKFWSVLNTILEREMEFRELVLILYYDSNKNISYEEQEIKSLIWKFGVYNNFRLVLLQELSNGITDLYQKAKLFLHVNSSVAKNVIQKADRISNFYITQFKEIKESDLLKEDNFIENCLEILNSSIQIGKKSLKL